MSPIPQAIQERLRCPVCGHALRPGEQLVCEDGHQLRFDDGYIDALAAKADHLDPVAERTFASFGYEWTSFDRVQPEDKGFFEEYFGDVDLDALHDEVGLDAGCGKARYTCFMAPHLRAIAALDGSEAVRSAVRNLADAPNALVIRADLQDAPLAPESFGFVSCLGVLHHLSDPRAGFDALVRFLAPNGLLIVYLYSRPQVAGIRSAALWAATNLRQVTVRLPHRATRILSAPVSVALYAGVVAPGWLGERVGSEALTRLPLATYRGRPLRSLWLDTFDRLSAPVENRYVWDDVRPWFEEAGLEVEAVSELNGLTIVARRPK
jgi:SAM-dependent methyltransferase